ncbi:DUF3372 domain-containing protein [Vibrio lentus]|nr:DUF3372 domain-containing protein [Vibrio lentus]
MSIDDGVSAGKSLDSANDAIVAIVNSTNESQSFKITGATDFTLSMMFRKFEDDIVKAQASPLKLSLYLHFHHRCICASSRRCIRCRTAS